MSLNENMILNEEEVRGACAELKQRSKNLEKRYASYIQTVDRAIQYGIMEGKTHDALAAYLREARVIEGVFSLIYSEIERFSGCYMSAVDQDDKFIY